MVRTNVPVICYQPDSRNSWCTTLKSWKCCWCKTVCTAARSHTVFHRKNERKSLNVQSNCPSVWQIQMVDWDHRKMNKRNDDWNKCSVDFINKSKTFRQSEAVTFSIRWWFCWDGIRWGYDRLKLWDSGFVFFRKWKWKFLSVETVTG